MTCLAHTGALSGTHLMQEVAENKRGVHFALALRYTQIHFTNISLTLVPGEFLPTDRQHTGILDRLVIRLGCEAERVPGAFCVIFLSRGAH